MSSGFGQFLGSLVAAVVIVGAVVAAVSLRIGPGGVESRARQELLEERQEQLEEQLEDERERQEDRERR